MFKNTALLMLMISVSFTASATPITSSSDTALSGATIITFDEQPLSTALSFTFGDVTFDGAGSNTLRLEDNPCSSSCVPDTGAVLANQTAGFNGTDFTIDFTSSVSAFGFGAAAMNSSLSVSAFDSLDNLIETFNFSGNCCAFEFGGIAASGISSLLVSTSDYMGFDNFAYVAESSSIPEPGSLALLIASLAGLGFSRRNKAA